VPPVARPPGGGRLFVVATPIGNLGDVTLRALDVLRSVPLVAAEDTRLTRRLFARHGIVTPLTAFHARSAPGRLESLLGHLRDGQDLAIVTDAGTPTVSDPGEQLIAAWADEGGAVEALPGASAVLTAVAASGISGPRWAFEGFLPRSGRERRSRLARLAADERGAVVFEAPARLAATLGDLAAACGTDRRGAVCRELTKLHETIERGTLGELASRAADGSIPARGEMTIVVGWDARVRDRTGADRAEAADPRAVGGGAVADRVGGADVALDRGATQPDPLARARGRVEALVSAGTARGEAARLVAAETGIPRRRLYGARPGR
jgi:16S rRNA (cytidine1402-2'-O)-methyltransferase